MTVEDGMRKNVQKYSSEYNQTKYNVVKGKVVLGKVRYSY